MADVLSQAVVRIRPSTEDFEKELRAQLETSIRNVSRQAQIPIQVSGESFVEASDAIEGFGVQAQDQLSGVTQAIESTVSSNEQLVLSFQDAVSAVQTSTDAQAEGAGVASQLAQATREVADAQQAVAQSSNEASEAVTAVTVAGEVGQDSLARLAGRGGFAAGALRGVVDKLGGSGIAAAGAAVGVGLAVKSFTDLASEVREFQRVSGAGAEEASRFVSVFKRLGIDADTAGRGLFFLAKSVEEDENKLAALGVQVARNTQGNVDLTETLLNVADAVSASEDPALRARLTFEAFGRSGQNLLPVLAQGREGLEKFFEASERGGQIMSDEDLARAKEFSFAIKDLTTEFGGIGRELGSTVIPLLTDVADVAGDVVGAFADVVNVVQKIGDLPGLKQLLSLFGQLREIAFGDEPPEGSFFDRVGVEIRKVAKDLPIVGKFVDTAKDEVNEFGKAFDDLGIRTGKAAEKLLLIPPTTEEVAEAVKAAAAAIFQAGATFDASLDSFVPQFGETFRETEKASNALGDSSRRLARAEEDAARRTADARREAAEAHEDAAERIEQAEEDLARAQIEAIRRVADARLSAEEQRIGAQRRFRDAQQRLFDLQAQLDAQGGTGTLEQQQRLAQAEQDVLDAREDARRSDLDGRRDIERAEQESTQRTRDAQEALIQAQEEAAERISDAQRKIKDAIREGKEAIADASRSASRAIRDSAKDQELTVASFSRSLRTNTQDLESFVGSLRGIASRVQNIASEDIANAFLARLAELGPRAAPFLRKLSKTSDDELKGVVNAFDRQIGAAKKAADLQFDRFPANFREKMKAGNQAIFSALDETVDAFEALPDKTGPVADEIAAQQRALALQIKASADAGQVALTGYQTELLESAIATQRPIDRANKLRELLQDLDRVEARPKLDLDVRGFERALRDAGGNLRLAVFEVNAGKQFGFQHGGTVPGPPGQAIEAVVHGGERIRTPEQEAQLLKTLQSLATQGKVEQNITVNQVAQDPDATAFAVAERLGYQAVR